MYLLNNINFSALDAFEARLRKAVLINFICALPFLLYVLVSLLMMQGFSVDAAGVVSMVANKYLLNLLAMPQVLGLLLVGLVLVIVAVLTTAFKGSNKGIWLADWGRSW